jgi:predicted acyl esterase
MKTDLVFTTSDGVGIALTMHHSGQDEPGAVIVTMTPYNRWLHAAPAEFLDAGFRVVYADTRGTGESGGVFEGMFSPREVTDGAELIEWLATQPFCDGKVAWSGASYVGSMGLLVAARRPRGLVCVESSVGPLDLYRNVFRMGGISRTSHWAAMVFLQGQPARSVGPALESYTAMACLESDDPLFRERSPIEVLDRIEVPVLFVGGVYDFHSASTFGGYARLQAPKRMVVVTSGHGAGGDPEAIAEQLRWFRLWLQGVGDAPAEGGEARVAVPRTDRWLEWVGPGDATPVSRPLDSSEFEIPVLPLLLAPPRAPSPTPGEDAGAGLHTWGETVVRDIADLSGGTIVGAPVVTISFRAEGCSDAHLFVRLLVIRADESVEQVTEGRVRLAQREVDPERSIRYPGGEYRSVWLRQTGIDLLEPGTPAEAVIELLPTCLELLPGDRLALGFAASRPEGGSSTAGRLTVLPESRITVPMSPSTA